MAKEYLAGCYLSKFGHTISIFAQIWTRLKYHPGVGAMDAVFKQRHFYFLPQHMYFTRMNRPGVLHSCDFASVLDVYFPASVDRICPIAYLTAVYRLPTVLT